MIRDIFGVVFVGGGVGVLGNVGGVGALGGNAFDFPLSNVPIFFPLSDAMVSMSFGSISSMRSDTIAAVSCSGVDSIYGEVGDGDIGVCVVWVDSVSLRFVSDGAIYKNSVNELLFDAVGDAAVDDAAVDDVECDFGFSTFAFFAIDLVILDAFDEIVSLFIWEVREWFRLVFSVFESLVISGWLFVFSLLVREEGEGHKRDSASAI